MVRRELLFQFAQFVNTVELYRGSLLDAGRQSLVLTVFCEQRNVQGDHGGHHVGAIIAVRVFTKAFAIFQPGAPAGFVLFAGNPDGLVFRFEFCCFNLDGRVLRQCGLNLLT